jgi:hypothetical protein
MGAFPSARSLVTRASRHATRLAIPVALTAAALLGTACSSAPAASAAPRPLAFAAGPECAGTPVLIVDNQAGEDVQVSLRRDRVTEVPLGIFSEGRSEFVLPEPGRVFAAVGVQSRKVVRTSRTSSAGRFDREASRYVDFTVICRGPGGAA